MITIIAPVDTDEAGRTVGYSASILTTLDTAPLGWWFHETSDMHARAPLSRRPALIDALAELGTGDTLLIESVDRLACTDQEYDELCRLLRERGAGLTAAHGTTTATGG